MNEHSEEAAPSGGFSNPSERDLRIDDRSAEMKRVLNRVEMLFEPHFANAERMGVELLLADVLSVLDALIAEADGSSPEPYLKRADEVHEYVLRSIFDELVGEPSNILYTTQVSPDVMRYDSMPADFWQQCLRQLKKQLLSE